MSAPAWNSDLYLHAWNFASRAHVGQFVPGTEVPYINHIGNVAFEAMAAAARGVDDPDLLIQCALLHDVIEDTAVTYDVVQAEFGAVVADGVLALTKDDTLATKDERMRDTSPYSARTSLARIQAQPPEVWMVKLCDRIVNMQPPPAHWDADKVAYYREEAKQILDALGPANAYLAERLGEKIAAYPGGEGEVGL